MRRDREKKPKPLQTAASPVVDKALSVFGGTEGATDIVNKITPKITGVLSSLGYAAKPTMEARDLWLDIFRKKGLPPDFIKRVLGITTGAFTGVAGPLLKDATKAVTQAVMQTALPAAASLEQRRGAKHLARMIVANQFDMYFFPGTRPLRIGANVDTSVLWKALQARHAAMNPDDDKAAEAEDDGGWDDDEPEDAAPPPPLPPRDVPPPLPARDLEQIVEKAVEEAVREVDLQADPASVPEAPPLPQNLVWKKVADEIEEAQVIVPKEDWAAAVNEVFETPATPEAAALGGNTNMLAKWAMQTAVKALQDMSPGQDPKQIEEAVYAQSDTALQLAMKARNKLAKTPPKSDKPIAKIGGGSNVKTALKAAETGMGFLNNLLGAFSSVFSSKGNMSSMIEGALVSGAMMQMPRARARPMHTASHVPTPDDIPHGGSSTRCYAPVDLTIVRPDDPRLTLYGGRMPTGCNACKGERYRASTDIDSAKKGEMVIVNDLQKLGTDHGIFKETNGVYVNSYGTRAEYSAVYSTLLLDGRQYWVRKAKKATSKGGLRIEIA